MSFDSKISIQQTIDVSLGANCSHAIDTLLNTDDNPAIFDATIENLISVLKHLESNGFSLLVDIFGVDYPERPERISLIYILLNMKINKRFHVKLKVNPKLDFVPTTCDLFKAANWFEREVFDMYGVQFSNHPNLQRILTDYGFQWHPMLKDFPLTGYKEVRYDLELKEVIYEDVNLSQEYRTFDFLTPWEGTKYIDKVVDKDEE